MIYPTFKYLRIITAIALLLSVVVAFSMDILGQSKVMFDGPLAHYYSYTFAINKIILAALLAVVLISDFHIRFSLLPKLVLQIVGTTCVLLSLIGFAYLIRHHIFMGSLWRFAEIYLFQAAYLLISLIVVGKGLEADWVEFKPKDISNV